MARIFDALEFKYLANELNFFSCIDLMIVLQKQTRYFILLLIILLVLLWFNIDNIRHYVEIQKIENKRSEALTAIDSIRLRSDIILLGNSLTMDDCYKLHESAKLGMRGEVCHGIIEWTEKLPNHSNRTVVLWIGINDVLLDIDQNSIKTCLRNLYDDLNGRVKLIALTLPLLRGDVSGFFVNAEDANTRIDEINDWILEYSLSKNFKALNTDSLLNHSSITIHSDDGVHLTCEAYQIINEHLEKLIQSEK